jgi:glycosyltransferase involved in cell wall biosynthesis
VDKGIAQLSVAVILPCHNEALSIAGVIADAYRALPQATIYVFDNNSTDDTAAVAARAGATVIFEAQKGKGNVVRRAFSDVEADVYLMADGDGTYDLSRAPEMLAKLLDEHLDMVVGVRSAVASDAYRNGHVLGNRLFNLALRSMFGAKFTDIFSGYRVFTRRFVKTFPALSSGFEIETEMSVHAIQLRVPTGEVVTDYRERSGGSVSKLKTYRDGVRILMAMIGLLKTTRPLALFGSVAAVSLLFALVLGLPVVWYFIETHTVPRLPTAVAAAGLTIIAVISLMSGIILDSVMLAEATYKRLAYLAHAAPTRSPALADSQQTAAG